MLEVNELSHIVSILEVNLYLAIKGLNNGCHGHVI